MDIPGTVPKTTGNLFFLIKRS
uniref:Uncharacterized protein n=1 Tax=Anguilla anguilla TaxID=7936 RepID=A0A0E9R3K0_ANGAN